jgi:hypothetical protein
MSVITHLVVCFLPPVTAWVMQAAIEMVGIIASSSLLLVEDTSVTRNRKSLMPPNKPIAHRRTKHYPKDRPCVIHILRRHRQKRRERQPNDNEDQEYHRKDVDRISEATESEGSPRGYFTAEFGDEEGGYDL